MSTVKLEVFKPGAEAETKRRDELAKRVAEAYREGHAKGFAQGSEASAKEHADAQDVLRGQFIETLRDAQLTQQAAQRGVIETLFPILETLTEALAPTLAEAGLASALGERLRTALDQRPDPAPHLICAPELVEGLEIALAQFAGRFTVEADPRLTPLEAQLKWADGFDEIDFRACLTAMQESIAAFRAMQAPAKNEEDLFDVG